jgi:hypothetical protein
VPAEHPRDQRRGGAAEGVAAPAYRRARRRSLRLLSAWRKCWGEAGRPAGSAHCCRRSHSGPVRSLPAHSAFPVGARGKRRRGRKTVG